MHASLQHRKRRRWRRRARERGEHVEGDVKLDSYQLKLYYCCIYKYTNINILPLISQHYIYLTSTFNGYASISASVIQLTSNQVPALFKIPVGRHFFFSLPSHSPPRSPRPSFRLHCWPAVAAVCARGAADPLPVPAEPRRHGVRRSCLPCVVEPLSLLSCASFATPVVVSAAQRHSAAG